MADGGEKPLKRARSNTDVAVESAGASGNSPDGPVSGYFAEFRVGPSQNCESIDNQKEPGDLGDLQRLLGAGASAAQAPDSSSNRDDCCGA